MPDSIEDLISRQLKKRDWAIKNAQKANVNVVSKKDAQALREQAKHDLGKRPVKPPIVPKGKK